MLECQKWKCWQIFCNVLLCWCDSEDFYMLLINLLKKTVNWMNDMCESCIRTYIKRDMHNSMCPNAHWMLFIPNNYFMA